MLDMSHVRGNVNIRGFSGGGDSQDAVGLRHMIRITSKVMCCDTNNDM